MSGNHLYRCESGGGALADRVNALEERIRALERKLERSRELLVEEELAARGLT